MQMPKPLRGRSSRSAYAIELVNKAPLGSGPIPRVTSSSSMTTLGGRYSWATSKMEITMAPAEDDLSSHVLVGGSVKARVNAAGESWPVCEIKTALKEG